MKTVNIFWTEVLCGASSLNHFGFAPYTPLFANRGTIVKVATVDLPEGVTVEGDHFCLDGVPCELYDNAIREVRVRVQKPKYKSIILAHLAYDFKLVSID
ncbi:MAG: hypothetical protein ACI35Q_11380 [Marinilabiliaceae bacterium]